MKECWIFGYGSLMWRPGFEHAAREPALIHGYHRRLCVYSYVHRGTPEQPGLVLGLDRGGSCHGMAFQIEGHRWSDTLGYLREREQVTMVYIERMSPVRLLSSGRTVNALTYVVDRNHLQYAGVLREGELLVHVRKGKGISGHCADYVRNTASHLREMSIHDATLESIIDKLDGQQGTSES